VLAVGLTCSLAVFAAFRSRLLRGYAQPLLRVAVLVVVAAGVQVGVNARVFGHATLMGPNVPFLMARIVADGPSHSFLEDYCGELHWTLCRSVHKLPWYEEDFLWAPDGIWQSASPQDKAELQAEEIPLLLGTLRTHPLRQFKRSSRNFLMELTAGGIADASYDNPWMIANLDNFHPGTTAAYLAARPRFNGLPRRLLRHLQEGVAAIAAALCLALLPWVWRKGNERLLGLETVVSFVVLANAFLTGVTSGQDARYEGRIIWLLPMLAFLLVGCLLQARWDKKIGSPPSLADVS
jgi:hypothetical protein